MAGVQQSASGLTTNEGWIGMKGKLVLLAALVLATAGIARADEMNVILLRQAGQDLLAGTFGGIRAVVAAKGDVKTLAQPATAMGKWMRVFPSTFPAGSDKGHQHQGAAGDLDRYAWIPEGRE